MQMPYDIAIPGHLRPKITILIKFKILAIWTKFGMMIRTARSKSQTRNRKWNYNMAAVCITFHRELISSLLQHLCTENWKCVNMLPVLYSSVHAVGKYFFSSNCGKLSFSAYNSIGWSLSHRTSTDLVSCESIHTTTKCKWRFLVLREFHHRNCERFVTT